MAKCKALTGSAVKGKQTKYIHVICTLMRKLRVIVVMCCRSKAPTKLGGILPQRSRNQPGGSFLSRPPLPKIGHTADDDQWLFGLLSFFVQLQTVLRVFGKRKWSLLDEFVGEAVELNIARWISFDSRFSNF